MKNTGADNENNAIIVETFHFNDNLTQPKGGQSLLKLEECNQHTLNNIQPSKCDLKNNEAPKSSPMGHKGRFYYRVLSKNNVTQESRSQSLPNSLDNKNKLLSNGNVSDSCDTQIKLLPENESPPQSPIQELWFNTWPERNEKTNKTIDIDVDVVDNISTSHEHRPSNVFDNDEHFRSEQTNKSVNNILTLNEALNSISLAYSPVTKQLHYIQKGNEDTLQLQDCPVEVETAKTKLGHRRNEAGSFSSTVSSLSDPSPSGSLLDAEDRAPSPCTENGAKSKKKGLTGFFSRNVFSWRSSPPTWNLFNKTEAELEGSPIHENIVASSSALIQHERPSHLPAKDSEEEQRHRDEYRAMLAAAKRREAMNSVAKHKQQKHQLQVEDQLASAAKYWNTNVLPKWDSMQKTKKTRDMWWQGLPSSVRGKIWRLAIGNDLNLTQQLYEICSSRAQNRLNSLSLDSKSNSSGCESTCSGPVDTVDQESSLDVIKLDIARTFPNLCIFQEGGPYSSILHSLLAAYVCYRPDVGYVQGMSFIAAVLILNMELFDAFICFANLLNRPLHLAAYTLNQRQMQAYYAAYNEIFNYNLPKLFAHFETSGLTPDLYLLDWVYTVFAKAMPLDVACRVWDVFLRDGDEFIFRTALGVLHLHQEILINMDFLHGAQFLTRLPDDLSAENLFRSIQTMYVSIGKQTFSQIVDKCKENL